MTDQAQTYSDDDLSPNFYDASASASTSGLWRWRLRQNVGKWQKAWQDGDVPILRSLPIQARFNILIAVVLVAAVMVGGAYVVGGNRISNAIQEQADFQHMGRQADSIRAAALSMQTAANGLIAERQDHYIADFAKELALVSDALERIKASPQAAGHDREIAALDQAIKTVNTQFQRVSTLTVSLGLGDADGLRGQLQQAVKTIETELQMWPNADDLHNRLLRMRQAEKDFMLYQDDSYLGKNRKYTAEFDLAIDMAGIANSVKDDLRIMAVQYSETMAAYGETYLEQQAAITQLRQGFTTLRPLIQSFSAMTRLGADAATQRQDQIRQQIGWLTGSVGLISLACILIVGILSGRSIARPVLALEQVMNRLAGGDHSVEIPGIHRRDEVGLMAKAVQVFRDNALVMQELRVRQDAEQAAKELRSQKLDAMIRSFDAEIGKIIQVVAGSAADSQNAAQNVDVFIRETLEQMRTVDQSSGQATCNVQAMAAAAEQLACSVREISARVSDAYTVAGEAADAAHKTDEIVHNLFDVTQQIDEVITFINTIAAKTRLLALNATIEAARAGDHGKGFSVVANEVKQLAAQTTHATEKISLQISAVQSAGREAVDAIQHIAQAVRRVNEISGTIAAAVEQQGAATQEIARSAQDAAMGASSVSTSITWVVSEAGGMQESASTMLHNSNRLTAQSEVLRAMVDNFLMGVHEGEPCLKWGESWLVGHPIIDRDHEALVGYVNQLSHAMTRGEGQSVLLPILNNLLSYTRDHFAREEDIWQQNGLPSLADHQQDHAKLLEKVVSFVNDYQNGKAALSMDVMAFLRTWLIQHVFKTDKASFAALRQI